MKRDNLSPEERAEADALFEDAGIVDGTPRPTHEIKVRLLSLLTDAEQAGRPWAIYVLEDALYDGLLKAWKTWNNQQQKLRVVHEGVIKPARLARGTRKRNAETGGTYYQQQFWPDMSWDEIRQQLNGAYSRIEAERVTVSIANLLLGLLVLAPTSTGPADAARILDVDLDAYLAGEVAL